MGEPNNNQQPDLFNDGGADTGPRKAPQKKRNANKTKVTCTKCQEVFVSVYVVAARYDVFPSTIWRWLKTVPEFPAPLKLTAGTTRWRLSDLVSFEAKNGHYHGKNEAGGK